MLCTSTPLLVPTQATNFSRFAKLIHRFFEAAENPNSMSEPGYRFKI